jgi:hypothetical protein
VPDLPILLAARCAACTAATALPLSLFLLLADIAAGGQLVLVLLDLRGEVTRGFLKLTTVAYLATALVAALVLLAAPLFAYQPLYHWGTPWVVVAYAGFAAFLLSGGWYALALFRAPADRRGSGAGVRGRRSADRARAGAGVGAAAALSALAALFATLASTPVGSTAIVLAFLSAGVVVGAVSTAMLLGHWYLVTPTLTSTPLQWTIGALFLTLALQALAFPAALVTLGSPGSAGTWRSYGLLSGLWALSAVAMPLTAVGLSWLTCRLRSFMSTTGLLYLAMASVLAGQIVGAELFLLAAAA